MGTAMNEEKGGKMLSPPEHKPFIRLKSRSGKEQVYYSVVYEGFPEEFQATAEKNLNETPEARKEGLKRLREYMKSEKMPPFKDDTYLLVTLRCCKYDMKKAEAKLKKLIYVRQDLAVRLRRISTETLEHILDDMPFGILPYRDKYGRPLMYTRPCGFRAERYTMNEIATVAIAGVLFMLSYPISSVSGVTYFADCRSDSLYIFCSIFNELRNFAFTAVSMPLRIGRLEVLYENSLCRYFYNIMRTLLPKKIYSKSQLHGCNLEELHKMYDPNILPVEYGGNMGPLSNEAYKQKFMDFAKNLVDEFDDKI